ncbi:MAG: hypothetical protein NXI10_02365 [bacterium]|nr:hypothetical protein [bacterium]
MKSIISCLLLILSFNLTAQTGSSELLGEYEHIGASELFINSVVEINGSYYSIIGDAGDQALKWSKEVEIDILTVSRFSDSETRKIGPELEFSQSEGSILSFTRLGSNPVLITKSYDKKSEILQYFVTLIDPQSLDIVDKRLLFETSSEKFPIVNFCSSPDYSKLGLSISTDSKIILTTFDSEAEKIWETEIMGFVQSTFLRNLDNRIFIENNYNDRVIMDNQGCIYMCAYPKAGPNEYAYQKSSHLFYISEDGTEIWSEELTKPKGYLIDYKLQQIENGIVCAGFYGGAISGSFQVKGASSILFKPDKKQLTNYNEQPISFELMITGYEDKTLKEALKDKEKGRSCNQLIISNVKIVGGKENVYLLGEQFFATSTDNGGVYYTAGDVIYLPITSDGSINTVDKITKRQYSGKKQKEIIAYSCGVVNEDLLVLFNDNKENPMTVKSVEDVDFFKAFSTRKAVPIMVEISPDGEASKSVANDDLDHFIYLGTKVYSLEEDVFLYIGEADDTSLYKWVE